MIDSYLIRTKKSTKFKEIYMISRAKSPFKKLFESEKQKDGRVLITYKKKNF